METLEEKIARVVREEVAVVPYDPRWPAMFEEERRRLLACLPAGLIRRIEHFGSTAVPGLPAKPIVDMLVEVSSLDETRARVVPILEGQGYEYFWRPSWGDDTPPYYAWFIKRDRDGKRTHHIHMVEAGFEHWDRLLFRDYLIEFPEVAREYGELKMRLSDAHRGDRVSYTEGKGAFIREITQKAKEYYATTFGATDLNPPALAALVEERILVVRCGVTNDAGYSVGGQTAPDLEALEAMLRRETAAARAKGQRLRVAVLPPASVEKTKGVQAFEDAKQAAWRIVGGCTAYPADYVISEPWPPGGN